MNNKDEALRKKNQTYRIAPEQIEQLDKLVEYYEQEFGINLSKANVVERLIKKDYEHLTEQGKIKS
jgi:hypothetical protein